jgi:hypothetical protein
MIYQPCLIGIKFVALVENELLVHIIISHNFPSTFIIIVIFLDSGLGYRIFAIFRFLIISIANYKL